jgi:hypothetical protein
VTVADRRESAYYVVNMRYPKRPRDTAEMAKVIVDIATEKQPNTKPVSNEGAVKRGVARAQSLSARKRSAIAKKAAAARWGRKKKR